VATPPLPVKMEKSLHHNIVALAIAKHLGWRPLVEIPISALASYLANIAMVSMSRPVIQVRCPHQLRSRTAVQQAAASSPLVRPAVAQQTFALRRLLANTVMTKW